METRELGVIPATDAFPLNRTDIESTGLHRCQ